MSWPLRLQILIQGAEAVPLHLERVPVAVWAKGPCSDEHGSRLHACHCPAPVALHGSVTHRLTATSPSRRSLSHSRAGPPRKGAPFLPPVRYSRLFERAVAPLAGWS
jgi:hypothetical protein